MDRRNAFKYLSVLGVMPFAGNLRAESTTAIPALNVTRDYWVKILTKIADPLLDSLSNGELHKNMPASVS